MNLNVLIESLGCAKNLVDSETMMGILSHNSFKLTSAKEEADVIIVNTCGFIESAKQESIDTILELAKYKKNGKCKILVVSGCLAERYSEELLKELPEVDAIVGTGNFPEIIQVIEDAINGSRIVRAGNIDAEISEDLPRIISTPNNSAYLKIADGCDNCCTYCIIPKLRGKYRSRKIEHLLLEAEQMAAAGISELIIIAQDTTSYGIDIYHEYKLSELLQRLCTIDGLKWIRLLYCYPEQITDELIAVIAQEEKICKYLDIPIQHCNDIILKKMNRRTNKENILGVIRKLRRSIPDIHLRTSLIVGFPGETIEQFKELEEFVKAIEFDRLGVFPYSMEEDTAAALFLNQIAEPEKQKRLEVIMTLQQKISLEKNKKKIGFFYDILIEEKIEEGVYLGRTQYDTLEIDGVVYINTIKMIDIGTFVKVRIVDALEYDLLGEMVDESS
ncbi:MAG: 30S ribosomal protein S12 methylthiotransferase RimO [Alkaliphilus sp.]|nr:30S ribosomal protein S12 methylthiotransferase RimO [Alkaliphilus sp.]